MPTLRFAHWLAAACFALFAVVQINDPDSITWVGIYGVAAVLCGLAGGGRPRWGPAGILSLTTLLWGGDLAHQAWNGLGNPMAGQSDHVLHNELVREAAGLWMVSIWMAVVTVDGRR